MTLLRPTPVVPAGRLRTALAGLAAVLVAAGLLAWNNLLVPDLPADGSVRMIANVAGVAALVAVARAGGLSWADLGLGRTTWRRGAAWGGTAVGIAAIGYAIALAVPATRVLITESPAATDPAGVLWLRALLLIPVGTVLCEELAFRGVLHALGRRALPARIAGHVAVLGGALVFGAWHVAGALATRTPGVPGGAGLPAVLVVTVAGGVLLAVARHRSGSLLAPVGIHLGTNVVGLVAVVLAAR